MPTLDSAFDTLVAGQVPGAAVRVERLSSGQCLFEGAAGLLRHGGRAMQPGDRYHLASIGKTFTAALVLQLAEEGRLGAAGIDTPLAATAALPDDVLDRLLAVQGRPLGHALTLGHLLQHTGGLRDAMVDDRDQCGGPSPGSLIGALITGRLDPAHRWVPWDAELADVPRAGVLNWYLHEVADAGLAAPGAAFHYSDTGYVLLGLVIEATTGLPLHQALQQRLLAPLGLVDTYLAYTGDPDGLPVDRMPESEPWMGAMPCLSAGVSLSFDWAGGGIVSTAAEQAAFLRALLQGRLFRQAGTLTSMTARSRVDGLLPPRTGVGLGLFHTRLQGIDFIGHSGAWGSKLFAAPALDLLVAGTLNRTDAPDDWHARLLAALA